MPRAATTAAVVEPSLTNRVRDLVTGYGHAAVAREVQALCDAHIDAIVADRCGAGCGVPPGSIRLMVTRGSQCRCAVVLSLEHEKAA